MLILHRTRTQSITIDHPDGAIVVHVLEFERMDGEPQVKLGIDAPRSVTVMRTEVPRR